MDSVLVSMIVVPGITALLLLLIFAYLYQQSRATYFLIWQAGWAAFCTSFLLQGIIYSAYARPWIFCLATVLQIATAFAIFLSLRFVSDQRFRFHWYDFAIAAVGIAVAALQRVATLSRGNVPAGRARTPANRNSHRAPARLLRVQLPKSRTLTRVDRLPDPRWRPLGLVFAPDLWSI